MSETKGTIQMKKLHFIGIGGVGMSGVAKVAKDQGFDVTGSDIKTSRYTSELEGLGAGISIGHRAENLPEGDVDVVVSTAILDNNPEYAAAKERGLKIMHRADMLAYLGRDLKTLAVAGTHGKTTTSSMLASVLEKMGKDPTFLIGGTLSEFKTNAKSGKGEYYVIEADESDKSFTKFSPSAVIVTNIEPDHLDHYKDISEIYDLFEQFISSVPAGGPVVVCANDEKACELARDCAKGNVVTYGTVDGADYKVENIQVQGLKSTFDLRLPDGRVVNASIPQNPGKHNVLNGASVLALINELGLDVEAAAEALSEFKGVHRRFDLVGVEEGVTFIDDYAHHPTEIAATIKAARDLDFNDVHVVFQPHRYSRAKLFTDVLRDDFAKAFDDASTVTFMDVYSAGEIPIPGVNGKTFLNIILDHEGHPPTKYVPRRVDVAPSVADVAKDGDLVITMGAGDVTELGRHIIDEIRRRADEEQ